MSAKRTARAKTSAKAQDSAADHGFVRVSAAVPVVSLADPQANARRTVDLLTAAADDGAAVIAFPELGLTGYSVDDLVQQDALLDAALTGLDTVRAATTGRSALVCVGVPLRIGDGLYNTAVVLHDGDILGVVPKSYLPNYREFYEQRLFAAARDAPVEEATVLGREVPFGPDLLFEARDVPGLVLHVEVCEDGWVPIPPSTWAALAGATVLVNLSGSPVTVGKEAYRRELSTSTSARNVAAHVYVASGFGESTTDLAWDGDALITENGTLLARTTAFATEDQTITADVDLDRLRQERARMISLRDQVGDYAEHLRGLRRIPVTVGPRHDRGPLRRTVPRFPFVPVPGSDLDARCREVGNIQVQGLTQRLRSSGIENIVIGVSGGLDSTLALLVAVDAVDRLGLPRTNIRAYTMPGFATGDATLGRALTLMESLGVTGAEIDIRPACRQMLADIDHPAADGEQVYDTTFENVQAGQRTSLLFRLANEHNALVLGTGDLSELALGWCTYGVGDQMSHYNVNGSVPKTLIRHLITWMITGNHYDAKTAAVLREVVDDVISPELVPPGEDGAIQSTEDTVGPYELHDFFLYYLTRYGYRPRKIAFLARQAWSESYDDATISKWLTVFLKRFMANQFKRSAMPNGPKVGSGGSLSPRGDWRSPSDASIAAWLQDLD
ncbi:NAD(+) synthase [Gordonia crocea]|uniref:NAD(+) synthase n=1 Tax=Gordonia crocea TaxID=589162 RepID=UPI001E495BB2|nr:NAD(+) synthase [Gordonia crocea]